MSTERNTDATSEVDINGEQMKNMILRRKESRARSRRLLAQNFNLLQEQCLEESVYFEDPEFTPDEALKNLKHIDVSSIKWKRPPGIVKNPRFFDEASSKLSIRQGNLGNCWVLGVVGNLTKMNEDLFEQVVPKDQSFDKKYAGIFHFRFWYYGRWVEVVIDDRLPTDKKGKLIFLNPTKSNGFWGALLEKAYAKLYGSYAALDYGGAASEAMEDFTGGIAERYLITDEETSDDQFDILLRAFERDSMLCCSIDTAQDVLVKNGGKGLYSHHAYSITHVKYVDTATANLKGKMPFVRLRNPHGYELKWYELSSNSYMWHFVPDYRTIKHDLPFEKLGEFWMSFENFKRYFTQIEIWNRNPKSLDEDNSNSDKEELEMSLFDGEWVGGVTAGGNRYNCESFRHNPRYLITLKNPNGDDEKCTLIVALMRKEHRRESQEPLVNIGFVIYRLDDPNHLSKPLDENFFANNKESEYNPFYNKTREVTYRFKLSPGIYCIVPTTYQPNIEAEFLLRIITDKNNNVREDNESVEIVEIDQEIESNLDDDKLLESFKESGKLDSEELETLWNDIKIWGAAFKVYDDGTGVLGPFKLRDALYSAGYKLNNRILNILGIKFCTKNGEITFDNFIMCAVHLNKMFDYFRDFRNRHPENTDSDIFMMMKDWMEDQLFG